MYEYACKVRVLPSLLAVALACTSALAFAASGARDPSGQWIGGSLLDGQRETAKTTLDLGAGGESGTLRIESRSTCTLRRGNFTPIEGGDASAWSLSFKDANGGESCDRLAKGKFVVRAGATARTLEFDVVYPASDGTSNHRHGVLSRYP
jgi:hypothetical protein